MATQKRIATGAGHDDFEDLDSSNAIHSVAEYGLRSTTLACLDKELARTRNDLERTVLHLDGLHARAPVPLPFDASVQTYHPSHDGHGMT
jgi:hypothetical protein